MDKCPSPLSWRGPRQAPTEAPPQSQPHLGVPQALWGLVCSGCLRPVSGSLHWQDCPQTAHLEGGCRDITSLPGVPESSGRGVPASGYDSEWSPGGGEGTPRGGHCSESLHALPLQGGKPRALGCQARSAVNRLLSKSPLKLRVVDLCDVWAQ